MAEFGPKVFHGLAYLADKHRKQETGINTFVTQDVVSECGFADIEDGNNVSETVQKLKNAIFKTLMFRARNKMYILSRFGIKLPHYTVTLKLRVSNNFLQHPPDQDSLSFEEITAGLSNLFGQDTHLRDELSALLTEELMTGGNNTILPSYLDKLLPDSEESYKAAKNMSGVCAGSSSKLNLAFKGDSVFENDLPDNL